jgi:hypothetical protein
MFSATRVVSAISVRFLSMPRFIARNADMAGIEGDRRQPVRPPLKRRDQRQIAKDAPKAALIAKDASKVLLKEKEPGGTVYPDDSVGQDNFATFGDLLVYLRQTYGERVGLNSTGLPRVTLTAQSVAACLKEHGYSMTSGSYSLLEQGKTLPKNPELFLEAVSNCLAVKTTSKYWSLLRFQYLFDHARRYMDEDFAMSHFPRGRQALDLLREGKL